MGTLVTLSSSLPEGSMMASSGWLRLKMVPVVSPSSMIIRPSTAKAWVMNSASSSRMRPACRMITPERRQESLKRVAWAASRLIVSSRPRVRPAG